MSSQIARGQLSGEDQEISHAVVSPPRIRVGFVMHVMHVAGAEVLVQRIIKELSDVIEPVVFCLDKIGSIGHDLQKQGIQVICLNRTPGIDWRLGHRLAQNLNRHQIEVVHAHQYTPFFYSALARLMGAGKSRVLFTEHGRHLPDVVSSKRRLVNRLLLQKCADVTNACSDFSAAALSEKDGFSAVGVIRNGIDVGLFPARGDEAEQKQLRDRIGLKSELQYVACVARLHPIKDHETLLNAWQRIAQQRDNARLLIVGDGERRIHLEQQAKDLGIQTSIEFLGVRNDVSDILRAVDVFTLSSHSEASSLTLLEAMASECPIVITDVGGNREHLEDGEQGLLVPRGDATQLAQSIGRLLDSPDVGHRLGEAARKRVCREFDLESVVESYSQLYQKLANRLS